MMCHCVISFYLITMHHKYWCGYACISPAPRNWRRRSGRPRHTWLRTVEEDLRQFNLGLASGLRRAQNRTAWRTLTGTATSPNRQAPIDDDDDDKYWMLCVVDIMKRTDKSQPDHENLRLAISALEEVMTYGYASSVLCSFINLFVDIKIWY